MLSLSEITIIIILNLTVSVAYTVYYKQTIPYIDAKNEQSI